MERLKKGASWAKPTQTKNATAPTDPDMMITAAEASKAAVRGELHNLDELGMTTNDELCLYS